MNPRVATRSPTRHRRAPPLQLQCPECTRLVRVPRRQLIVGGTVYCRHCDSETELALGFDGETGRKQWMLLDALADYDDDAEERRA